MTESRREKGLPFENLLAIAAGLAWIASGEGVWGFWLGAIPVALMLAGGTASLMLPGEVRMPQLIALGSAGALVATLPMIFVVGWIHALELVALAVASIIATRPDRILRDVSRLAREVSEAHALVERSGWLEKPASYHHRGPPLLTAPLLRLRRSLGFSFESGYESHLGEPGREHWLSHASNRGVHAWVLRHRDLGRPWLICIPGYGTGMPMIHFSAFDALAAPRSFVLARARRARAHRRRAA